MRDSTLPMSQPRSRRTHARLLEALEHRLRNADFDQIAVADIARDAGVSVGTVYAHFADKNAFLEGLLRRHLGRLEGLVDGAHATRESETINVPPDLRSALRGFVTSAMTQVDTDAHIIRALTTYQRKTPDAASAHALQIAEAGRRRLETFLTHYTDEIGAARAPKAATLIFWFLNSIFYRRAVAQASFLPPHLMPTDEEIVAFLVDTLHRTLTSADAPPPV